MKLLYLNHFGPDDGAEQGWFGDRMDIAIHRGPGDPADMPTQDEMAQADGIICCSAQFDVGPPTQYPNCRIIVRMGVGFDNIDGAVWGAAGIPLCNVPDYGTTEVADHAVTLMASLARGVTFYQEKLAADPIGNWGWAPAAPTMKRLRGAVFGVVGLGRIGLAAARRAHGFDMEVVFYDPHLPNGVELATGFRRVHSLAELMGMSDAVSIHAPLSAETRNLIDARALAAAKPGLLFVNTARGPLVDLDALYDAMKSGIVAGAGLDVLPSEPPEPLPRLLAALRDREEWLHGRLIVTPHAAFYTGPALADMRRKAMEVVYHYLHDGRLMNCVNTAQLRRNQ
jgi:lactate dehydrogenase-like 2-hydroxyacid dehydrogenase